MISVKNLTLLLAVLLMGLCLVSSVSAMDIDDSVVADSSDLSTASVSSDSNGENIASVPSDDVTSVSSGSNEEDLSSVSGGDDSAGIFTDSNVDLESQDASISNVNSENEVLSTDINVEDSDLKYNSKPKNVLSAAQATVTTSKAKTTLIGSSSTLYRGNNYVLTLTDVNGKVLSGQKLNYVINGKTYTLTTDAKGSTYLQINLKDGQYAVTCSFLGTGSLMPASFSTTLKVLRKPNSYTIAEIEAAAVKVKNYVSKNRKLPKTVKVGTKSLKISEFTYLASKAIYNINSNKLGDIVLLKGIANGKASSKTLKATIYKEQYVSAAKKVVSKIKSNKVPPASVAVYKKTNKLAGYANLNVYTFAFAKILAFHKTDKYLPNYCSFKSSDLKKIVKKPSVLKTSKNTIYRGKIYKLTLTNKNGKVLKGQKLSYKINGKTYTLTTDAKGSTYLQINLKAGKYVMVCSYAGSKVYKSAKKTVYLTVKNNPNVFSINQIETAATTVKDYVSKNKKLPTSVKVGSRTLKISEFSYLASKAVSNLNSNNRKSITLIKGISDGSSSAYSIKSTVNKTQYVDLAKRSSSNIVSKKVPASYLTVTDSSNKQLKANFRVYTFAFAKILAFDKTEKYLPNYCTFESSVFGTKRTTSLQATSSSVNSGGVYSVKLTDKSGNALSNQKITFTVSGKTYDETTNSNGVASLKMNLKDGTYSVVTSYVGSSKYKTSKLSNTVTVKNDNFFTINEIEAAATNVKAYVNSYKQLPSTVTVASKKISISQFSYLMAKAVYNINAGNLNSIALPNIASCNSAGNTLKTTVYKAEYMDLVKRVVLFDESNKISPVYATVYSSSGATVGKSEFKLYTYAFSKILVFHKTNRYLPNYCTFESSVFQGASVPTGISTKINYDPNQFKNGLNEKNTESDLGKYLVATAHATFSSSIKALATKLTKGLTTKEAKALAIYKYVRDEIGYSYYADTRYGATGTLNAGAGNCVDQASLVVALCRVSGVPARYSHAQGCTFSSGLVTGHVWAQVLVNGVWYSADATSVRNNLGNIKNWNTNSYYSVYKYTSIPF